MATARLSAIERTFRDFIDAIAPAPIALIGGLAISARTEPRFTRDIDVAVAVADDASAEAVVHRLSGKRFKPVTVLENTTQGRLGTVRLRRTPRAPIVDLLFASSGIEPELVTAADRMIVLGRRVAVATVGHLIALKLLARDDEHRPQDRVDLRALSVVATEREWRRAATAVKLIEKRGFARKRDLQAALVRLRAEIS